MGDSESIAESEDLETPMTAQSWVQASLPSQAKYLRLESPALVIEGTESFRHAMISR